ncbi:rho guanine nucleotide exchange factor 12 isoform X2 [Diorhabda sublineata]|uniref:rho guanine nucleotide exchange factor 12 isoform X2 n=1 Tax=Diorhabda sublineata TaxID=1163346 RepID=UPI0024E0C76F|nr:rho guanine nucleotide exchange factor 12 isoform X2 [Diorhabda sublineata]
MDNFSAQTDSPSPCMNGSMRRPSPSPSTPVSGAVGRPASLMDQSQNQQHVVRVFVIRDEHGYGMKVSGDNPVYVQSVKEGGAAEKAGLHAGDKIVKVNGVNVMQSTHTQVVALIKSSSQVVLTVQQRSSVARTVGSPSTHNRPVTTPTSSSRITGPQPVDNEKQYQLQLEKEQYYRLMIEKEQHYIDLLRSQIASSPDEKKYQELAKTERNLHTLQAMLQRSQSEQHSQFTDSSLALKTHTPQSPNGNSDNPPPLPKRNNPNTRQRATTDPNKSSFPNINGKLSLDVNFINNEINANAPKSPKRKNKRPLGPLVLSSLDQPPPLPPRSTHSAPTSMSLEDAVNSINKQMSYPLVATCATLVNDDSPNPTHHRTKSSPETLTGTHESSSNLKTSESLNDLNRQEDWETPPGTPPPPYPSPQSSRKEGIIGVEEQQFDESFTDSPETSFRSNGSRILGNTSPIHAATPQISQQPIMSMEDDEISDQEINQLEDHGHFKSLSRLWEHLPHLAVFMNYILSNSDPHGLMFYLLTDLYKEGNAKEMRKWAFEIHSCFLVPGAPLRLSNVDENIAREIDEVLTREYDKEEILRKIFWKARSRAKEELTRQLADFQQKRTAGLGTIYGPTDAALAEVYHDKAKETKLYETLFLEKLDPYLEEIEKESYDIKRFYMAAALTTVLTRIFQIRPPAVHALDRCPTFVNKEKSFRTKFIGKYSRKLNIMGHQFVAQQYYTVIFCSNCHQILYGIGPQGYQCTACLINLHRHCVRQFEDSCPGPITKKDRGIMKLIGMRHDANEHSRIKKSSQFLQMERDRRQAEEINSSDFNENEVKQTQPVSRSGSDRRPDAVREEGLKHQESSKTESSSHDIPNDRLEAANMVSSTILPAAGSQKKHNSNINRSESVKEQSEKQRKQQRRNISDPSHSTTSGDVDLERHPAFSNTDSGSSSNSSISCNGRLSESPSNSVDAVIQDNARRSTLESDSDIEHEQWESLEELKNLPPHEKKRQDVINELFLTENSHVTNLKVLYCIFYKKILESHTLKPDELNLIFANIKEILDLHTEFNKEMRKKRREEPIVREVGTLLANMFGEKYGELLKNAAAKFCERQQMALEFIKKRRERDSKFDAVLAECEKKRQCRRLPFQGILPTQMQRLSKYPLLIERLIHSLETNTYSDQVQQQEELSNLKKAHQMSKDILNHVNEAAKLAHNKHRLEEIQKHLDTSGFERSEQPIAQEFRTFDLTKFRLILEGGMQLRRPNKPVVPVHILLLEEAVIILHRDNDRFLLKFFQSGSAAQPQPLSPIIKMSMLLARANAVCKNALFLVNMAANNSQMYDLIVEDEIKREIWFKHFTDATESYKRQGKSLDRQEPASDSETESVQDLPPTEDVSERAETVGGAESPTDTAVDEPSEECQEKESESGQGESKEDETRASCTTPEMVAGGGIQTTKVSAEEWPLIQPSQVNVAVPPVHIAESMLTPLEQIRRKDAMVKQALEDKEGLVADMLSIPREHFEHIADMASIDPSIGRDPSERVLASIFQVNQLQKAVNESLNITELDAMAVKGGKHPTCASQQEGSDEHSNIPTIPTNLVREIASSLNSQLTTLLSEVKQIEEERDRLRKELHRVRERLHEEHNLHNPLIVDDDNIDCASEQSGPNDSLQIVTKSDCEESEQ